MDGSGGTRAGKKLKEAAAYWARGGGELDQAREDLRAFGADDATIEAMLGPDEQREGFAVWPQNWAAVQAFLAVQTQWHVGMGGPTGLDYARVRVALDMAGIAVTPELFEKLRIIEAGALDALAKRTPQPLHHGTGRHTRR